MSGRIGLFVVRHGSDRMQAQLAQMRAIFQALLPHLGTPEPSPEHPTQPGHMPTEVTADGRISTEYGPVPMRVSDAIKAAWPEALWSDAARVSYLESTHWSPVAERNTLGQAGGRCGVHIGFIRGVPIVSEDSVGLFQVNVCAWPYTREQMLDPDQNAAAGYVIYRRQGWEAWHFSADTLGLL